MSTVANMHVDGQFVTEQTAVDDTHVGYCLNTFYTKRKRSAMPGSNWLVRVDGERRYVCADVRRRP